MTKNTYFLLVLQCKREHQFDTYAGEAISYRLALQGKELVSILQTTAWRIMKFLGSFGRWAIP